MKENRIKNHLKTGRVQPRYVLMAWTGGGSNALKFTETSEREKPSGGGPEADAKQKALRGYFLFSPSISSTSPAGTESIRAISSASSPFSLSASISSIRFRRRPAPSGPDSAYIEA